MKPGRRRRTAVGRVDVPGRQYAMFAAQWLPYLGFDHPYSIGQGDMDVPEGDRRRIDAMIDRAQIPPDPKPEYPEWIDRTLELSPAQIEPNRVKYEAPESPKSTRQEAELARERMLEAHETVLRTTRTASLTLKQTRKLERAVETYAQAAFEHGEIIGRLHEQFRSQIQIYKGVDAIANLKAERAERRLDAICIFLIDHPLGTSAIAEYVKNRGQELRDFLRSNGHTPPAKSNALQKLVSAALKTKATK